MAVERFLARQPIFDTKMEVAAYELLFRSDLDNYCKTLDTDLASSTVIDHSVLLFDLPRLTDGRLAFVNIGREGLIADHARLLPRDIAVVEILETVAPDADVVAACRQLVEAGYRLALDDFVERPGIGDLVAMASYVKVDVLATPRGEIERLARTLRRPGLQLLAEKVETRDEFERLLADGFELFQGYFFAKPTVIHRSDVAGFKTTYLQLLRDINREPYDIDRIERLLKQDVSISYKFLRYINSAAVGLRNRVSSIRETLLLLGVRKIRALGSVWALAELGQDQPEALLTASITRARFCESLAPRAGLQHRDAELFLAGMLSLIDVIVGRPMASVIDELPVSEDVRLALVERRGELYPLLACVLAYERGEWSEVSDLADRLRIDERVIPEIYLRSIPTDTGVVRIPAVGDKPEA